jgi:hypothetical protein
VVIGPYLPLSEHREDYYLAVPVIGLAMVAAWALVYAWRADRPRIWKAVSAVLVAVYLALSVPAARGTVVWYRDRAERHRELVMGVARAHALHPGKVILLEGIEDDLFWGAITQGPFAFLGITNVYLTPGTEARITPHPELDEVSNYILPVDEVQRGLARDALVVYRAGEGRLRNITQLYSPEDSGLGPLRVDPGDPLAADRLGPTWYPAEAGYRWMPRSASVRMPGPRNAAQKLYVTALCSPTAFEKGPLQMTVIMDGVRSAPVEYTKQKPEGTFAFALPPEAVGKRDIEVVVEVDRTTHVGADERDLGLAFGRFEIK